MAVRAPLASRSGRAPGGRAVGAPRIAGIDTLRGLAILAMIGYHAAFDLTAFGVARFDFDHDPGWLASRAAIVSTFLALVGVSLSLAQAHGVSQARRWRRIATIAGCAVIVSLASWLMTPRSWIWFGILHAIAIASVIAWPFVRHPGIALSAGVVVIVAGLVVTHPAFDAPALAWIGFTTVKPVTEDYVPLFPWLGVVLLGVAAGDPLIRRTYAPLASLARWPRAIAWLGRHSLAVYMIHQPVLIGVLALALRRFP